MARSAERIQAIALRKKGKSIIEISRELSVSKASVSRWCMGIVLSEEQIANLEKNRSAVRYQVILEIAKRKHEKRENEILKLRHTGAKYAGKKMSQKELMMLGSALYWGEGIKNRRTGLINSNPGLLKVFILWLEKIWNVPKSRLILTIRLNSAHKHRVKTIEKYWSETLGIPLDQFSRTLFIDVVHKKKYDNEDKYFGTVTVYVKNGGNLNHILLGLISGIEKSLQI